MEEIIYTKGQWAVTLADTGTSQGCALFFAIGGKTIFRVFIPPKMDREGMVCMARAVVDAFKAAYSLTIGELKMAAGVDPDER